MIEKNHEKMVGRLEICIEKFNKKYKDDNLLDQFIDIKIDLMDIFNKVQPAIEMAKDRGEYD